MNKQLFADYRLDKWDDLPTIPLYMDQVIYVLNEVLGELFSGAEQLKPTTVNNYVKNKLVPAPDKKKYGKGQISRLIVICILKKVLTINEISLLLTHLAQVYSDQEAYDLFAGRLEQTVRALAEDAAVLPTAEKGSDAFLDSTLLCLAGKLLAEGYAAEVQVPTDEGA